MGKGSLRLHALSPNQSLIRSSANDSEYPAKVFGMGGILALWENLPSMNCCFDVSTILNNSENPAKSYFRCVPLSYHTNDEAVTHEVKAWISECDTHHTCSLKSTPDLPTRVIDVGLSEKNITPSLQISKTDEKGSYLALSYCWGGPQKIITTLSSLESHIGGFPLESLPKTIQDAINVSRALGIRYLWVDALCIIQDSPEDKAAEIERIGTVYKNATLTVAATSSASVNSGFFLKRETSFATLPIQLPRRVIGSLAISKRSVTEWTDGPLDSRAWAFQEFLLSRRILLYGKGGTIWRLCQEETMRPLLEPHWKEPAKISRLPIGIANTLSPHPSTGDHQYQIWKALVTDYSRRELTQPEDRLSALAGIANELIDIWQDEYRLGTWRGCLVKGLLWKRIHFNSLSEPCKSAPTWSWASVNSAVEFNDCEPDAEVIDCTIAVVDSKASQGQVKQGRLTIRGFALASRSLWSCNKFTYQIDNESDRRFGRHQIVLLQLGSKHGAEPLVCGIMLTPVIGESYRRIGVFQYNHKTSLTDNYIPKEGFNEGRIPFDELEVTWDNSTYYEQQRGTFNIEGAHTQHRFGYWPRIQLEGEDRVITIVEDNVLGNVKGEIALNWGKEGQDQLY